jgi:hypothetical protein
MKIQNEPGIYVYYISDFTKQEKFYYFENIQSFAKMVTKNMIDYLIVKDVDGIYKEVQNQIEDQEYRNLFYYKNGLGCKFFYVCDHNGYRIPRERIVEEYNKIIEERSKRFNFGWSYRCNGRKKPAYGHHYAISGFRTRKNDFIDEDVLELGINVKYRRKAVTPDSWVIEKHSHNEKCWKKQRKVKHQWERK